MLDLENMRVVAEKLVEKTEEGKLRWDSISTWDVAEGLPAPLIRNLRPYPISFVTTSFACHTPATLFHIHHYDVAGAPNVIVLSVLTPMKDKNNGDWIVSQGDEDWRKLELLYDCIRKRFTSERFEDVLAGIDEGTVDQAAEKDNLSFEEAANRFFRKVAGSWKLEFYRGSDRRYEELRIDDEGNYFIPKYPDKPYFQLRDVYFDPDGHNVSFAKFDCIGIHRGRVRQVEVLRIDPNWRWMKGYAQHDEHRLEYTRLD